VFPQAAAMSCRMQVQGDAGIICFEMAAAAAGSFQAGDSGQ